MVVIPDGHIPNSDQLDNYVHFIAQRGCKDLYYNYPFQYEFIPLKIETKTTVYEIYEDQYQYGKYLVSRY